MHVLMFGWEFPPRISGGLGRACYGITRGLAERGVDVSFVMPVSVGRNSHRHIALIDNLPGRGDGEAQEWSREGESLHLMPVESPLMPYMTEEAYDVLSKEALKPSALRGDIYGADMMSEVKRYALNARSVAKETAFDIIHAHDWMTVPAALEARRVSGKPLIVHIHSLESDRSGLRMNERIYAIERTGMMEADRIIAVSRYTAGRIVDQYGVPREKIAVVHNAAALSGPKGGNVKKNPLRKYVLFLGRITGQKGPGYFIEAAARVIEKSPETHFIMAGEGDLRYPMKKMVREMGVEGNVHFPGFLSEKAVELLYRYSDLFILSSISEPFGMTVLEALSFGTPVIVSRNAGVLEVVPDCMTVDPGNVEEMAEKIMIVLNDGVTGKAMVKICRNRIHDLTWENVADSLIEIYREMIHFHGSVMN